MKKFLLFCCCLISIGAFAQVKLGVEAGYNLATFGNPQNNQFVEYSPISTFQVGLVAKQKLLGNLFLQSGLSFTGKGTVTSKTAFTSDGSNTTTHLWYAQVPIDLGLRIRASNRVNVVLGGGVYGAFGIAGTEKGTHVSSVGGNTTVNNNVSFTDNNTSNTTSTTYVRPFDTGYNLFAGLEWPHFQVTADFSQGFKGVYPTAGSDRYNNQVFGITFGYFFKMKG